MLALQIFHKEKFDFDGEKFKVKKIGSWSWPSKVATELELKAYYN